MMWKEEGEKKKFHILKLFNMTTESWEVLAWWTCCYHCIEHRARQNAGTKKYSGISLIWQRSMLWILYCRHFRQNGKPHKDQRSFLQVSLELSVALILANKVIHLVQEVDPQNKDVWEHLKR